MSGKPFRVSRGRVVSDCSALVVLGRPSADGPGPVMITRADGSVSVQTAEEFRALRGLAQCPRCLQWETAERLTSSGEHACRWAPSTYARPEFQSGVDAWFSDRPVRRRRDDEPDDPVEA